MADTDLPKANFFRTDLTALSLRKTLLKLNIHLWIKVTWKVSCFLQNFHPFTMWQLARNIHASAWTFRKMVRKSYANVVCTLLYIIKILEDIELLHQVFFTEAESLEILTNTPQVSQILRHVPSRREQNKQDLNKKLLTNDDRNGKPKVWVLKKKEKQSGTTPRCRGFKKQ